MTLNRALVRNVGTCRPDAKGGFKREVPRGPNTDGHRGGGVTAEKLCCSVMEPDRRGCIVQAFRGGAAVGEALAA